MSREERLFNEVWRLNNRDDEYGKGEMANGGPQQSNG